MRISIFPVSFGTSDFCYQSYRQIGIFLLKSSRFLMQIKVPEIYYSISRSTYVIWCTGGLCISWRKRDLCDRKWRQIFTSLFRVHSNNVLKWMFMFIEMDVCCLLSYHTFQVITKFYFAWVYSFLYSLLTEKCVILANLTEYLVKTYSSVMRKIGSQLELVLLKLYKCNWIFSFGFIFSTLNSRTLN